MENSSDNRYDSRFDSDFAASVLLDLAQERSLDGLMEKTLGAAMTQSEIARVEIWLIEKGDIYSHCAQKSRCPDQTHRLHLIAASENSAPAGASESSFFYNTQERVPLSQAATHARRHRQTGKLSLARQHPRTAERHRTRHHHFARRRTGLRFAGDRIRACSITTCRACKERS
jgi:hypothetical protein